MAVVGGSMESVSIARRLFAVASDASASRKLGGFENEVEANGNATARMVKTRAPWSIDGLQITVDDNRGDQEFLQDVANRNEWVPMAITLASNVVYDGLGTITGEIQHDSQNSTATVSLSGPGELNKQ
jgi:hypothetical protein